RPRLRRPHRPPPFPCEVLRPPLLPQHKPGTGLVQLVHHTLNRHLSHVRPPSLPSLPQQPSPPATGHPHAAASPRTPSATPHARTAPTRPAQTNAPPQQTHTCRTSPHHA